MTVPPPLVSVLVPIYNHARFIETCLASVRDCGYPRLELVLLDDGSSDGSLDVARAWLERHGSTFERVQTSRQENQGIPRTLNRLVEQATGEFVALLASDDALLPGGIASRVEALQAAPERMAAIGDCIVIDDDGHRVADSGIRDLYGGFVPALRSPRHLRDELAICWSVPGPVFLARRCLYESGAGVGPYDDDVGVEDRDFYLRLLKRDLLLYVDRPVAAYRLHDRNAFKQSDRRPALLASMRTVERRHLRDFRGLARLALWLRAVRYDAMMRYEGGGGLAWRALVRLLRAALDGVHALHVLFVRIGRSAGGESK